MASSELLKQIQAGRKLKHSETNDRSAPQVDTPKSSGRSNGGGGPFPNAPLASGGGSSGGPPQLGGLFAGGMPKLKPAGGSNKLGKPPSIPKSDGPQYPARNVPIPPAPIPARPVPSPRNDIGSSSAPLPPRRAPPAIRAESPPATPRTRSPVSRASPTSRPIPAVPTRNPMMSPTKPKAATPGRVPPPLPRSHAVDPSPARTAPAPPARKPPSTTSAAVHIDSAARTYSPELTVPMPPRANSALTSPHLPPPSRRLPLASSNGDRPPRRKIPSPSPNAGVHIFLVTGFPPPPDFKNTSKIYKSGRQRGCNFDLGNL